MAIMLEAMVPSRLTRQVHDKWQWYCSVVKPLLRDDQRFLRDSSGSRHDHEHDYCLLGGYQAVVPYK